MQDDGRAASSAGGNAVHVVRRDPLGMAPALSRRVYWLVDQIDEKGWREGFRTGSGIRCPMLLSPETAWLSFQDKEKCGPVSRDEFKSPPETAVSVTSPLPKRPY